MTDSINWALDYIKLFDYSETKLNKILSKLDQREIINDLMGYVFELEEKDAHDFNDFFYQKYT